MNIKELADKHEAYMIAMRRYFHENPETSGEELQIIAAISRELTGMSVDHVEIPQGDMLARNAIGTVLGQDVLVETEPWMGSETFSLYQLLWPGVFAFLGIRNEEKGTGAEHHNPFFDVDESVLTKGAACAAAYAVEFLRSSVNPADRRVPGGYETVRREVRNWAGLGMDSEDEV